MKIKVGLVQIGENFGGQYFLPFSMGLLQAYAVGHLSDPGKYEFLVPVYRREDIKELAAKLAHADIVFFSCYLWNMQFSLALAKELKSSAPETYIVFGGPQIPCLHEKLEAFLKEYSFIDYACYGEGELPFCEILEKFEDRNLEDIASLGFLTDGKVRINPPAKRIEDLDTIPSPYLSGVFDPLMKVTEHKWAAMIETNRGCPFSCSYCTWGNPNVRHVYKYDLQRVFEEIDWFSRNKIEFIFCCDANFGIFPDRDLEIVEKVVENKDSNGYPHVFSVQSTKNATDTIFKLQKKLNDHGLQKGVNLALQSTNPETLKSIKRSNITQQQYFDLQSMFRKGGVSTFSDLIIGLPDETYETFTRGVSDIIASGQHNRIQFINLVILENSEMADPAYMAKHGIKTCCCKIMSHHTSFKSQCLLFELNDLVVETNSMPPEDWKRIRVFCWLTSLLYFNKVCQIPILLIMKLYGYSLKELIDLFLEAKGDEFPVLHELISVFENQCDQIRKGEPEYVLSEEFLGLSWPADEYAIISTCKEGKLEALSKEAQQILLSFLSRNSTEAEAALVTDAIRLNMELFKLPLSDKDIIINTDYNILEAYASALANGPADVEKRPCSYHIFRSSETWDSWEKWMKEVIWFGSKQSKYLYAWEPTGK